MCNYVAYNRFYKRRFLHLLRIIILSFSKTAYWHILYMQHWRNLSTSQFLTYDPNSPDVIGEPH